MKRELTKHTGVYQRTADSRKHAGKPDICFDIAYRLDGKLIWEKVGWLSEGYSAKLASDIRSERLRSMRHGKELPRQKTKAPYFKDIAKKYLDWATENKSRAGRDDAYLYKNHLASELQDKRANEISSFDLERLKDQLKRKGLAPASVKHCLVLVRQMFNKAQLWNLYDGINPVRGVKMPVIQNQRERFFSYDEAALLLNTLTNRSKTLHSSSLLALHCGLRAGEIFNLKGQDLDFNNRLINIADPKNKRARKAFMTEDIFVMLLERRPSSPDEYIFRDKRHGGKIQAVSPVFRKTVNELGFNKGITDPRQIATFHTLRHTFASWLALQGETLLTIKELLGHRSIAMTERYSHLIPDHKRRAINNMETNFQKMKKTIRIDETK
jgi:integrase